MLVPNGTETLDYSTLTDVYLYSRKDGSYVKGTFQKPDGRRLTEE